MPKVVDRSEGVNIFNGSGPESSVDVSLTFGSLLCLLMFVFAREEISGDIQRTERQEIGFEFGTGFLLGFGVVLYSEHSPGWAGAPHHPRSALRKAAAFDHLGAPCSSFRWDHQICPG